jgi:hypothetical protein
MTAIAVRINVNMPSINLNTNESSSPIVKKIPKISNIISNYFSTKVEFFLIKKKLHQAA